MWWYKRLIWWKSIIGGLKICGGGDQHQWKDISSQGLSGGILTIWDDSILECLDELIGPNTLSQKFKNKADGFGWYLTDVYSPCTYWDRDEFWEEVEDLTGWVGDAWCMAGDFNATMRRRERNKHGGSIRWLRFFNEFMEKHELIDLPLNWGRFTWSNMQADSLLCRLDRVLVYPTFEGKHNWKDQHGKW